MRSAQEMGVCIEESENRAPVERRRRQHRKCAAVRQAAVAVIILIEIRTVSDKTEFEALASYDLNTSVTLRRLFRP